MEKMRGPKQGEDLGRYRRRKLAIARGGTDGVLAVAR